MRLSRERTEMAPEFDELTPPPDREALLDDLARCFVQAAVTRLMKELREAGDAIQQPCSSRELPLPLTDSAQGPAPPARKTRRTSRRRTDTAKRAGVKCGTVGVT
jgi:hypothetical protein